MKARDGMAWDFEKSIQQAHVRQELLRISGNRVSCVYFITSGCEGGARVKIGKCTGHPDARLAQLQTGSAQRLRLLTFVIGDREKEREFHSLFDSFRIHPRAEWFRFDGVLRASVLGIVESMAYGDAVLELRKQFELAVCP